MSRRILHLDMDAFFAAVELLRRPELEGKPVVVGGRGDPTRRGVVSTADYEARKYGIHSAMPLRTAYRLCPHAVFLPVDYAAYREVSERIKAILREVSPAMQDVGIDEAYLDITEVPGSAEEIGRRIKRRIREGTGLTASVGIAPNKFLAKIASDLDKPDGLTILTMDDVPRRIWPLPVRTLWGVGPKTEARLDEMGIRTIGELAARPVEGLVAAFGEAHGRHMHETAHGHDERPVTTEREPKSVSRETTFQEDVDDKRVLARVLRDLVERVGGDLRRKGVKAKTVGVKLRYADFTTLGRQTTLDHATDDPQEILDSVYACMRRIPLERRVRLIGVRCAGLVPAEQEAHEEGLLM